MRYSVLILMTLFITNCASVAPTSYGPPDEYGGGYLVKSLGDGVFASTFSGNGATSSEKSYNYSKFRAVEFCRENGYMYSNMIPPKNMSSSKTYYQTYTNDYGSTTSPKTINFPMFKTLFSCVNKLRHMRASYDLLSESYFLGLIDKVNPVLRITKTSARSVLRTGDLVYKINNNYFSSLSDVRIILGKAAKPVIKLNIIRDKKETIVYDTLSDVTSSVRRENYLLLVEQCKAYNELSGRPICKGNRNTANN